MLISNVASDNISFLLNKNSNLSLVENTIINDETFTRHSIEATTILSSNQTSLDDETAILNTLRKINSVCFAIIILTGLCGNGFSIFVIARSHLRKISSNHYLIALATSDSLFLVGLCMMWLSRFDLPTYHENGVCSVVIFLLNCSSWMSSWYTTALTVERCFVVYKPLSKNKVCTVSRTRRTIICLIPWPLLFNLWVFFGTGVTEQGCNVLPHFFQIGFYLNALDTLLTFVIPILSIVICNTLICVKLCRPGSDIFSRSEHRLIGEMRKHGGGGGGTGQHTPLVAQTPLKQSLARGTAPDIAKLINNDETTCAGGSQCNGGGAKISCGATSAGAPAHAPGAATSSSNQERNITITLLTISFVFVFMNLPSYAMRLRLFFLVLASKENNHHVSILIRVLEFLFLLLYYTNFSCNFIVYCLSSKNFRQTVQKMWHGKLHTLSSFSFSSSFPFRYLSSLRSNRTSRKTPPPLDQ